jgi:hypothetical protein
MGTQPTLAPNLRGVTLRVLADNAAAVSGDDSVALGFLRVKAKEYGTVLEREEARELLAAARRRPPQPHQPETDPEQSEPAEPASVYEAWPLLRELLDRPELLAPPQAVLPSVAWRGRATLLAAPDKAGKSTLAAHGVAQLSRGGWWLGERTPQGRAVVCAPDEALGDTVRRLGELSTDPDHVRLLSIRPPDMLAGLRALLSSWPADLVVVDSLAEWARIVRGAAPEDGDSAGWGLVVRPLVQLCRDFGCALLLLHHPRRSDGQYRGSGEIAAAVDCLLEMRAAGPGEDQSVRRITGRARWPVQAYAVALHGGHFELVGGTELSADVRVLMFVERNPGTSKRAIREAVGGRATAVDEAIDALEARGAIERREDGKLYPAHSVQTGLEAA